LSALGFVHGDLKARNVLLAADGGARLVDFAAARPPEPDVAADRTPARWTRAGECAAFATIVYELVAGRPPFALRGGGRAAEPLPVPSVPPAVADLLAVAVEALRVRGRVAGGLAVFEDVIESALADASNN
jgi:hypothetical protein